MGVERRSNRSRVEVNWCSRSRRLTGDCVGDHVGAVEVVPGTEQEVQKQQLESHVGDVHHLRGGVQHHQVVAVTVADAEAEETARQVAAKAGAAAGPVALLVVEVVVEVPDHVLDRLLAALWVQRVLDGLGRLHHVVDVDAGAIVEQAPEQTRYMEQQCLYSSDVV